MELSVGITLPGTLLASKELEIMSSTVRWCWRRMEKISWTDRLRNEILEKEEEERNILQTIKEGRIN